MIRKAAVLLATMSTVASAADITVNPTQTRQTWLGSGASIVGWGGEEATSGYLKDPFLKQFTQDMGMTILRVDILPDVLDPQGKTPVKPINFTGNLEEDLKHFKYANSDRANAYVRVAKKLAETLKSQGEDFKVVGTVWTPPHWMKEKSELMYGDTNSAKGNLIMTEENLTQWSRYLAASIKAFEQAAGMKLYAFSIQNEPLFPNLFNSMVLKPEDYAPALARFSEELKRNNMDADLLLFGPEHVGYGEKGNFWQMDQQIKYIDLMAKNGAAMDAIDAFAIHGYGGDGVDSDGGGEEFWDRYWNAAKKYNKLSWHTETGGGEHKWESLKGGNAKGPLNFAVALVDGMNIADVGMWVNWQFWDNGEPSEHTLVGKDFNSNNSKFAVAKQYFRHIRPGAVRVGTEGADGKSLKVTAWHQPQTGNFTVVMVNLGEEEQATVKLPVSPGAVKAYLTDASHNHAELKSVTKDQSVSVTLPPESVVTITAAGR